MENKLDTNNKGEASAGGRAKIMQKLGQNPKLVRGIAAIAVLALIGGVIYWQITQSRVYIENSVINAPIISLTPKAPGIIDKFYVSEGDHVRKNQVLVKVGDELIKAKDDGVIVGLMNNPGQMASQQDAVVKMIQPKDLKVIGKLDEDKGLNLIRPGQKAIFTADAFGSKEYEGVVESIAPTSSPSDIVFNIADTRQENVFDIKVDFDKETYPELKNGMSARMWIYR